MMADGPGRLTNRQIVDTAQQVYDVDLSIDDASTCWLAAIGAVRELWRNGPIEDVHAANDALSDPMMFRLNVEGTRIAAEALIADAPSSPDWCDLASSLTGGERAVGDEDLRSVAGKRNYQRLRQHSLRRARTIADLSSDNWTWTRLVLAAQGCSHDWYGHLWWPQHVEVFVEELVPEASTPPPGDVGDIARDLTADPIALSTEALGWCVGVGLSYVPTHRVRDQWISAGRPRWSP
jgi:hypothetical protein